MIHSYIDAKRYASLRSLQRLHDRLPLVGFVDALHARGLPCLLELSVDLAVVDVVVGKARDVREDGRVPVSLVGELSQRRPTERDSRGTATGR